MTEPSNDTDLDSAIRAIYRAPLDEFISRRDALAKQLRTEKRRDDATLVRALRKPSRMAWTLDSVAHEDPDAIARLASAIGDAQSASDFRAAVETVKEGVRAVAAAGARIAVRAEHPIEPNALAAAVHAIIGDATAFADLRAGRLVDVPAAGGLDLLLTLPALPSSAPPTTPALPTRTAPASAESPAIVEPPKPDPRIALGESARAEVRRAEKALGDAESASERATTLLRDAEADLAAAERALREAQGELETRRAALERSQRRAESVTTELAEAKRAVDNARAQLAKLE